jgi:hypothetical protein
VEFAAGNKIVLYGFEVVIPEPSVWTLVGAGFGLMLLVTRRRRQSTR